MFLLFFFFYSITSLCAMPVLVVNVVQLDTDAGLPVGVLITRYVPLLEAEMTFNIVALTTSLAELTQALSMLILLRNSYSPLWLGSCLSVASNTGNTLDVQVIVLHLPLVIHLLVLLKTQSDKAIHFGKINIGVPMMPRYKYFTYGISQKI